LKKVGPSFKSTTCDEVKAATSAPGFSLVHFGENEGESFNVFSSIANGEYSEKVQFLTNDESACAGEFGGSFPGFSFLRQFDEKKIHNSEINAQTVLSWMGASMIPTIQEFSEDSIEGIFGERKQAIILFRKAGDE